jgi:hypothetical protein
MYLHTQPYTVHLLHATLTTSSTSSNQMSRIYGERMVHAQADRFLLPLSTFLILTWAQDKPLKEANPHNMHIIGNLGSLRSSRDVTPMMDSKVSVSR